MKKKVRKHQRRVSRSFGQTEFLLLLFVTLALLTYFGWQTGTLPKFLVR